MIKLRYYEGTKQWFLEDVAISITWGGDIAQATRSLNVSLMNATSEMNSEPLVKLKEGGEVRLFNDSNELFRGIIFETSINEKGEQEFTAYDEAKYLTVNSDNKLFKNKTASDIIKQVCKEFGLSIGNIKDTGYAIKHLVWRGDSIFSVFVKALSITKEETNKKFWFYMKDGLLHLEERTDDPVKWVVEDGANLMTSNKRVSIEDLRNIIVVSSGSIEDTSKKMINKTAKDDESVQKYGMMKEIVSVGDMKESRMMERAKKELTRRNKPEIEIDVDAIGHVDVISGKSVYAFQEMTGLNGAFYVLQDTHTFEGGKHTMALTLSETDDLPYLELTEDEIDELKGIKK